MFTVIVCLEMFNEYFFVLYFIIFFGSLECDFSNKWLELFGIFGISVGVMREE